MNYTWTRQVGAKCIVRNLILPVSLQISSSEIPSRRHLDSELSHHITSAEGKTNEFGVLWKLQVVCHTVSMLSPFFSTSVTSAAVCLKGYASFFKRPERDVTIN